MTENAHTPEPHQPTAAPGEPTPAGAAAPRYEGAPPPYASGPDSPHVVGSPPHSVASGPHPPHAAAENATGYIPPASAASVGYIPTTKPTPAWRTKALAGATLVAVALGSGAAGAAFADSDEAPSISSSIVAQPVSGGTVPTEQLAKVAADVAPTVVSIAVSGQGQSGEGSGIVLRPDGTILTNNHVVETAASGGSIRVSFAGGKTATAELVGRDPSTDLAVIRAKDVSGLPAAKLGAAESVHVGDTVLAIGSPLGLDGSVSAGIVSALHRPVVLGGEEQTNPFGGSTGTSTSALVDAIQTDAAINPGNSGGALVDAGGRVIGVNTAIATLGGSTGGNSSGSIGVGFAIPIEQAAEVADTLLSGDTPTHAVLGVQSSDSPEGDGAVVGQVVSSGPAEEAGLKEGDRITAIAGRNISDATDLAAAVRSHKPGDKVEVTLVRDGDTRKVTATLDRATS